MSQLDHHSQPSSQLAKPAVSANGLALGSSSVHTIAKIAAPSEQKGAPSISVQTKPPAATK